MPDLRRCSARTRTKRTCGAPSVAVVDGAPFCNAHVRAQLPPYVNDLDARYAAVGRWARRGMASYLLRRAATGDPEALQLAEEMARRLRGLETRHAV